MLLIGSRALKSHIQEMLPRQPKDWDFICWRGEVDKWNDYFGADDLTITKESEFKIWGRSKTRGSCEFELITEERSSELYFNHLQDCGFFAKRKGMFIIPAPLYVLYSLKKSHIIFPIKFQKNIGDYAILHEMCGGIDKIKEITKTRQKEIEERLKLPTVNLNKSKEKFFNNSVKRIFVHDDLHDLVKFEDKPLFKKIQKPSSEVFCDKGMFYSMDENRQIKTVAEEATVIALERYIVPFFYSGGKFYNEEFAFCKALEKLCTTMTKGWFRQFAVDNFNKIVESRNKDYVELFLSKADSLTKIVIDAPAT